MEREVLEIVRMRVKLKMKVRMVVRMREQREDPSESDASERMSLGKCKKFKYEYFVISSMF